MLLYFTYECDHLFKLKLIVKFMTFQKEHFYALTIFSQMICRRESCGVAPCRQMSLLCMSFITSGHVIYCTFAFFYDAYGFSRNLQSTSSCSDINVKPCPNVNVVKQEVVNIEVQMNLN